MPRETPTSEDYIPLEVRVDLASPVILSYPWIMLDSLLAHLVLEQQYPELLQSLPPRDPVDLTAVFLPLLREDFVLGGKPTYLYHASCSRFGPAKTGIAHLRKKIAEDSLRFLNTRKRQIDVVRGPFKAYDMSQVSVSAKTCVFYCVGQETAIRTLLEGLQSLGKKRAAGYGRVINTQVLTITTDCSFVHPEFGLNRPLPVAFAEGRAIAGTTTALLAYKPPYWGKQMVALCYTPSGFAGGS